MRFSAAALLVAAVLAAPAEAAADECPFADAGPGAAERAELEAATLCLVNRERARAGRRPVAVGKPLPVVARRYAAALVASRHFAHQDVSGGTVVDRLADGGWSLDPWNELGENLGWGSLGLATPRAMVAGWMNSRTHRSVILYSRFNRLGVGVAEGAPAADHADALTYVAVFGEAARPKRATKPKRCTRAQVARARLRGLRCRPR